MVGLFMRRTLHQIPKEQLQQNSLLLWNMTDEPIRVTFRPRRYYGEQELKIDPGARGVFQIDVATEDKAPLKQITVYYKETRYRFLDREHLNTIFETRRIRYFAVGLVGYGQEEWPRVAAMLGSKAREKGQYMVLSNYPKLGQPFGERAILQVLRA